MKHVLLRILGSLLLLTNLSCGKAPFPGGDDNDLDPVPPIDSSDTGPIDTIPIPSFYFGVNGHPVTQHAYRMRSAIEQINLIKSLGMNIYRIDVTVDDKGQIKMHDRYVEFKKAADSAGVTLLPMLYHPGLNFNFSEEKSYQLGFERGQQFAKLYKDDFVYYNLANELDTKCILPEQSGTCISHYDPIKFKVVAAQLKGMNDGVKSVDFDAKTMINAGWMHYQYLLMLEQYDVDFDIVAYHWYDEMEALAERTYGIKDITQFLSSKFSKPIWFTEVNVRNATGTVPDRDQSRYLNNIIAKCQNNPQVKAVIIYELFNQPVFQSIESHYGLYTWSRNYETCFPKLWAAEQTQKVASAPK